MKLDEFKPECYQDIVEQVLVTSYLGTEHSSKETTDRSKLIAESIGSYHFNVGIDEICAQIQGAFIKATNKKPKF